MGARGVDGRPATPAHLRPSRVLQKWQCVEDATGTLKLHKCKGPVRPRGRALSNLVPKYYSQGGEACSCDGVGYQLGLPARRKKFFKKSECGGPGGPGQEGRERSWVAPFCSHHSTDMRARELGTQRKP